jgi:hypothetical protein
MYAHISYIMTKTQQVINGEKRMINLNVDPNLWRNAKVFAAQKHTTLTNVVEHLLRQHLDTCKHDKIN